MREIRQSGSEGGEVMSLPDPYSLVTRATQWFQIFAGRLQLGATSACWVRDDKCMSYFVPFLRKLLEPNLD